MKEVTNILFIVLVSNVFKSHKILGKSHSWLYMYIYVYVYILAYLCTLDGTRSCSQIHIKLPGEVILTSDTFVFHPNDVKLPGRCREPPYDRCHKDRWVVRWGFEG